MYTNGILDCFETIVKHEKDKDNQVYAYRLVAEKCLKTISNKWLRSQVRLVLNEALEKQTGLMLNEVLEKQAMSKTTLKIDDIVKLWNGSFGNVIGLEHPMITITNPNTYPQTFHKMNIKTINGVEYDGRDVYF